MELRHLRYLVTVVDEGTVTAAAEKLHVAQPGVSAQLRRLERELGAAAGAGVAVVPEPALGAPAVLALERPPVAIPLEPEVRARLYLAWRSGGPTGPAARALLDVLRDG